MNPEAIDKLVELLRVFINSPYRTKADAEVLEAKLIEFENILYSKIDSLRMMKDEQ